MTAHSSVATLGDRARLDQWLQSKPAVVIAYCKKIGVPSLSCLPAVAHLKAVNPQRHSMLLAEARAQNFPV